MPQQLQALAALPEDAGSIPSATWWFTTKSKLQFRGTQHCLLVSKVTGHVCDTQTYKQAKL